MKRCLGALLIALSVLPRVVPGGEQVILQKDFLGPAMRKTKAVDGWLLPSYSPGELSREQGSLKLKATPSHGRFWGSILCPFRNGNLTGAKIRLQYKVKGSGKIRFGAVRYRVGQKLPEKTDTLRSEFMELGGEFRDYEFVIDFGDIALGNASFIFELHGEGGEAVIESMTVKALGDTGVVIQVPEPLMVKDSDPLPDVKFRTNRPGKKFTFFTSVPEKVPPVPAGSVVADDSGIVTVPGKSLLQDQVVQEVFLTLAGNALYQQPVATGCKYCEIVMDRNRTVGSVVVTKIPAGEYDDSLAAARRVDLGAVKTILILADSIWDLDRGTNAADRIEFFLRKAHGDRIRVVNYAVHGDRINKMAARFKGDFAAVDHGKTRYRDLDKEDPELIMIMLGHNDTASNSRDDFASPAVPPKVQKEKYEELLAGLKEKFPRSKVILLSPLAVNYENILKRCEEQRKAGRKVIFRYGDADKVEAFRKVLAEVAAEHKLPLFDLYTPTLDLPDKASYFRPDSVHLSPRGFGLLAKLVLQELAQ